MFYTKQIFPSSVVVNKLHNLASKIVINYEIKIMARLDYRLLFDCERIFNEVENHTNLCTLYSLGTRINGNNSSAREINNLIAIFFLWLLYFSIFLFR